MRLNLLLFVGFYHLKCRTEMHNILFELESAGLDKRKKVGETEELILLAITGTEYTRRQEASENFTGGRTL